MNRRGQPICWPVTPYYRPGDPCIDVTHRIGVPQEGARREGEPEGRAPVLRSRPAAGMEGAPQVLVQGTADVDHRDLDANRDRYRRESLEKLPGSKGLLPPPLVQRAMGFYFTRIYVHVRPERVYVWPDGDATREPRLFDAHMEEVRSGHDEEPDGAARRGRGRPARVGRPDGRAGRALSGGGALARCARRLPVQPARADRRRRRRAPGPDRASAVGLPVHPGLACLTAHDHHPDFRWQRNFQVRGDLVEDDGDWVLIPHRMVGGLELPPVSRLRLFAQTAREVPGSGARQKKRDANLALEERATGDRGLRGCAASLTSSGLRSWRSGPRLGERLEHGPPAASRAVFRRPR